MFEQCKAFELRSQPNRNVRSDGRAVPSFGCGLEEDYPTVGRQHPQVPLQDPSIMTPTCGASRMGL